MTEKQMAATKTERLARFGRNINLLGALAIGGVAAVIPGPNAILSGWATLNIVQAGGFELWRQNSSRKRAKSNDSRA